jgi:hypothetical protein
MVNVRLAPDVVTEVRAYPDRDAALAALEPPW